MRASVAVLVVAWLAIAAQAPSRAVDDWPAYGHDGGGMRFSPLTDVNRTNVDRLQAAWTVHTGDIAGKYGHPRSGFETTPIVVDGVLYFTTAFNRVVALDPETGAQKWAFDPTIDRTLGYGDGLVDRGVSTWLDSSRRAGEPCRRRIFEATLDARLIALDAVTGTPCDGFGRDGTVSLADVESYRPGAYHLTCTRDPRRPRRRRIGDVVDRQTIRRDRGRRSREDYRGPAGRRARRVRAAPVRSA